jgi:hypothetical protein
VILTVEKRRRCEGNETDSAGDHAPQGLATFGPGLVFLGAQVAQPHDPSGDMAGQVMDYPGHDIEHRNVGCIAPPGVRREQLGDLIDHRQYLLPPLAYLPVPTAGQVYIKMYRAASGVDVPRPTPGPGQIIAEVAYAGICGSDCHIQDGDFQLNLHPPVIMGHEFSGTITEISEGVKGFSGLANRWSMKSL